MKTQIRILILASIVAISAACASGGEKTEVSDAKTIKNSSFDDQFIADLSASVVNWQGYKPTGTHHGTVNISDGKLNVKDGKLVGGEFTIDLNTITDLDIEDAEYNAKLTNHLKSVDFFDVEKFPTAKFVITEVTAIDGANVDKSKENGDIIPTHAITGNLTMKDKTNSITFNARVEMKENMISAETNQFFIDRVKWDVRYGSKTLFSDLKDKFINDEMGIEIKLVANKSEEISGN